jgi:hypothetical protein
MNALRSFKPFAARHRAMTFLIVAVLPVVLAACTNGGSAPIY